MPKVGLKKHFITKKKDSKEKTTIKKQFWIERLN